MSEHIIEMINITKCFPGVVANDHVTIQITKGEVFALLGENGAGKSVLANLLFGMYEPDEGTIHIRGEEVVISSPQCATTLGIGMVQQHFQLVSNYTVAENIMLGAEPMKRFLGVFPCLDFHSANDKIEKLSAYYGLEVQATNKISDLSLAAQQRVEILKLLYRDMEIFIFDEPTALLTSQEIGSFFRAIKKLKESGKTVLLITHKLEALQGVADRCAILNRGKLIGIWDAKRVKIKELVRKIGDQKVSPMQTKPIEKRGEVVLSVRKLTIMDERHKAVLRDVSFSVRQGEIVAIVTEAGNGQNELADAIAGMIPIASGTIYLNNIDITHHSVRERIAAGIAYVPEDRMGCGLVSNWSLCDNLVMKVYHQYPFSKGGVLNRQQMKAYSDHLIQQYDIRSPRGGQATLHSVSGGNQQKTILAREIERDYTLLILVQPTAGLDIVATEQIQKKILGERQKGKAILLITSDLDELLPMADMVATICDRKEGKCICW